MTTELTRRRLLTTIGAVTGAALAVPQRAFRQSQGKPLSAPTVISNPPRDFGPERAADDLLHRSGRADGRSGVRRAVQANTSIKRLWTGALWAEGPAWNSQGRYLLWSDIPNNRQMRWLEDDGRVTVFRSPSNNSNGNTFDYQGRQLSCEHLTRRVVRYEHDGIDHDHCRRVPGQAAELAERRRRASRTAASGSPIRPTAASLRRGAGRRGGPTNMPAASIRERAAGRDRHVQAGAADQRLSRRSGRPHRPRHHRRSGARSERPHVLARLQEALRREHRQGTGRHGRGRQGRGLRVRRRHRQQGCRTGSCSPIA